MPAADLVLTNANVITMESAQPSAEIVAVRGERIWLVAKSDELDSIAGAGTKVIDCQGRTIVPGFNDAHCHLFSFIRKLLSIDLSPASVSSIEDIKAVLYKQASSTPPGEWLTGSGYNEFYLAEKRYPNRWDIDVVTPNHPVLLIHRTLHVCVLNSRALALAGITGEIEAPRGGFIDRDLETGEPNGILYDMLGYIQSEVMPSLSGEKLLKGIALADRHYREMGITSLQDATVTNGLAQWQTLRQLKDEGKLSSRVYMMFGTEMLDRFQETGLGPGAGDNQLRLGGGKIMLSEATGRLQASQSELNQQVFDVHRRGFQVAIHAIEEDAVASAITALEYAFDRLPQDARHRIEHCSECSPSLLERLSKLPVAVVSQPPFLYYSGERYLVQVPPEKQKWLYPFESISDRGVVVAGSSDSPVVPDNPLVGIYAAVNRRAESGQSLLPEECVSISCALSMYTTNAAYVSFEEDIKGSIAPGKLADMVVLTGNPVRVPVEEIKDIRVEMTILGGKVVWER